MIDSIQTDRLQHVLERLNAMHEQYEEINAELHSILSGNEMERIGQVKQALTEPSRERPFLEKIPLVGRAIKVINDSRDKPESLHQEKKETATELNGSSDLEEIDLSGSELESNEPSNWREIDISDPNVAADLKDQGVVIFTKEGRIPSQAREMDLSSVRGAAAAWVDAHLEEIKEEQQRQEKENVKEVEARSNNPWVSAHIDVIGKQQKQKREYEAFKQMERGHQIIERNQEVQQKIIVEDLKRLEIERGKIVCEELQRKKDQANRKDELAVKLEVEVLEEVMTVVEKIPVVDVIVHSLFCFIFFLDEMEFIITDHLEDLLGSKKSEVTLASFSISSLYLLGKSVSEKNSRIRFIPGAKLFLFLIEQCKKLTPVSDETKKLLSDDFVVVGSDSEDGKLPEVTFEDLHIEEEFSDDVQVESGGASSSDDEERVVVDENWEADQASQPLDRRDSFLKV